MSIIELPKVELSIRARQYRRDDQGRWFWRVFKADWTRSEWAEEEPPTAELIEAAFQAGRNRGAYEEKLFREGAYEPPSGE